MSCVYYHAVREKVYREGSGVPGYCRGSSKGEIRAPSMGEYQRYCVSGASSGCPVYRERLVAKKSGTGHGVTSPL